MVNHDLFQSQPFIFLVSKIKNTMTTSVLVQLCTGNATIAYIEIYYVSNSYSYKSYRILLQLVQKNHANFNRCP